VDEYYGVLREAKKGDKILLWVKRGKNSQFVVLELNE